MTKFRSKVNTFLAGEAGTTSVEYAVMLVLIVGACITAITTVGGENGFMWGDNSAEIEAALR